ncbi:MAG: hypothetical protein ACRD3Q_11145, partial [Terriglobales bacterium]
ACDYLRSLGNAETLREQRRNHPELYDTLRWDTLGGDGYTVAVIEKARRRVAQTTDYTVAGEVIAESEYPGFYVTGEGVALRDITRAEFAGMCEAAKISRLRATWYWLMHEDLAHDGEPTELSLSSNNRRHAERVAKELEKHGYPCAVNCFQDMTGGWHCGVSVGGIATPLWLREIASPGTVLSVIARGSQAA